MKNKTCGECKYYKPYNEKICLYVHRSCVSPKTKACNSFAKPTLFDRITQSPEVLAAESVYAHENCRIPDGATSPFIDNIFWFDDEKGDTWDERFDSAWEKAKNATVARLKEVADE